MSSPFAKNILQFRTALIPKPSEIGWTDFNLRFNDWRVPGEPVQRTGPLRTTPVPFRLIGNASPIVLCQMNPARRSLMIQNKDPTNILYVGFGSLADANAFEVQPKQTILLDFKCPTDPISVFATVDLSGYIAEIANQAE